MLDLLEEATVSFMTDPDKHLLILFDYRDSYISSDYLKAAEKYRAELKAVKTGKGAALGIVGIKKILLKAYNALSNETAVAPFDSKEEALDYLVQ